MISSIELGRYRCFPNLHMELDSFHLLVGANGTGKTTLLDAFSILSELMCSGDATSVFLSPRDGKPPRADIPGHLINNTLGDFFTFAVEADIPTERAELISSELRSLARKPPERHPDTIRYEIMLGLADGGLEVRSEALILFPSAATNRPRKGMGINEKGLPRVSLRADNRSGDEKRVLGPPRGERDWVRVIDRTTTSPSGQSQPTRHQPPIARLVAEIPEANKHRPNNFEFRLQPDTIALQALPPDHNQFPASLWFRDFISRGVCYYDPSPERMAQASPSHMRNQSLRSDGANLPWLALRLKERDPRGLENWIEHARLAIPSLKEICPNVRADDGHAYLELIYTNDLRVRQEGLSSGTLRILAFTILPYLTGLPPILSIEEPENGIHPKAIQVIVEGLQEIKGSQVFVTTHSPIVVASVELNDVYSTLQKAPGEIHIYRGKQNPRVADWKGNLDPATLFATGVLGA